MFKFQQPTGNLIKLCREISKINREYTSPLNKVYNLVIYIVMTLNKWTPDWFYDAACSGVRPEESRLKNAFFRVLKISGKMFSRQYELFMDSQESILGMVVCKFILLVFSGGDSLLFFMSSGLKSGGSLSPDLVVVLDTHVLECYLGHC